MTEIETKLIGGVTVVSFLGRLDVNAVEEIRTPLKKTAESRNVKLVLDLSEVSYMSSRGISLLLELLAAARQAGGGIRLAGVQPFVSEILDIAGIRVLFNLYNTVGEAVSAFRSP